MQFVQKGALVSIKYIIGETVEEFLSFTSDGKFRFTADCYVDGDPCKDGFYHLRQARKVIPDKDLGSNLRFWPRMRKALQLCNVKRVHIPGGKPPIHYCDEMVVPDFSISGSHYFVIKYNQIDEYLSKLPLDKNGEERALKFQMDADHSRQHHDAKFIARAIGHKIWFMYGFNIKGEFRRITLIYENDEHFSVIYPSWKTNLLWSPGEAKVLCEAPKETGIEFLSGVTAGRVKPEIHNRIKQFFVEDKDKQCAYLMPNPELAHVVKEKFRWMDLFDTNDNDGIDPQRIVDAKEIHIETFDINDNLMNERIVYCKKDKSVIKENISI